MRRDTLEASVLNGLRQHLVEPVLFGEFCAGFTREVNRLRMEAGASLEATRSELVRIDRELDKHMKLILASDDLDASKRVMRKMNDLEARKDEIEWMFADAEAPPLCCIRVWRSSIARASPR